MSRPLTGCWGQEKRVDLRISLTEIYKSKSQGMFWISSEETLETVVVPLGSEIEIFESLCPYVITHFNYIKIVICRNVVFISQLSH